MPDKPLSVLLTDRAWPDDDIERGVVSDAGFDFVAGPPAPGSPEAIRTLVARHDPSAILVCWAPVTRATIDAAPALRVVARMGVGLDNIDLEAAANRGVVVTNVPDYCVPEVSDHAIGLVLAWTRGIVTGDRAVRAGRWNQATPRLRRLASLTCGIIGYGRIGRETARKLAALGATVVAADPHASTERGPVRMVDLDTLLGASDVVIVHAPLTTTTRGMIGAAQLALMRPGSLLVNVSRGGLVETAALMAALADGHLEAAGLDVLDTEPDVPEELLAHDGVVMTPHTAFSSDASLLDLRRSAAEDVVAVLRGEEPRSPVRPLREAGLTA